jgi:hypothetical protein
MSNWSYGAGNITGRGNWRNTEAAKLGAVNVNCHLDKADIESKMKGIPDNAPVKYFYPNNSVTSEDFEAEAGSIVLMKNGTSSALDLAGYEHTMQAAVPLDPQKNASDYPLVIASLNGMLVPRDFDPEGPFRTAVEQEMADSLMSQYRMAGVLVRYDAVEKNDIAVAVQAEGIVTMVNTSNQIIYKGQWAMPCFPLPSELSKYKATRGAHGNMYTRIPVSMKPVDPSKILTVQELGVLAARIQAAPPVGHPTPKMKVAQIYMQIFNEDDRAEVEAHPAALQAFIDAMIELSQSVYDSKRMLALSTTAPGQEGDFLLRA